MLRTEFCVLEQADLGIRMKWVDKCKVSYSSDYEQQLGLNFEEFRATPQCTHVYTYSHCTRLRKLRGVQLAEETIAALVLASSP